MAVQGAMVHPVIMDVGTVQVVALETVEAAQEAREVSVEHQAVVAEVEEPLRVGLVEREEMVAQAQLEFIVGR